MVLPFLGDGGHGDVAGGRNVDPGVDDGAEIDRGVTRRAAGAFHAPRRRCRHCQPKPWRRSLANLRDGVSLKLSVGESRACGLSRPAAVDTVTLAASMVITPLVWPWLTVALPPRPAEAISVMRLA